MPHGARLALLATALVVVLLGLTCVAVGAGASTPAAVPGSLVVSQGRLWAVGSSGRLLPDRLTGINGYDLTSDWAVNSGCGYGGWSTAALGGVLAAMHPGELVRTWFFQSAATSGGRRDWRALDRVVALAAEHHVHLVATLANQDGACDDGRWKTDAWYAGGYRRPDGPASYATWVAQVVARYAAIRAVSVWEPVNEPLPNSCTGGGCYAGAPCPASANADLVAFLTAIGDEIHHLDPSSLVSDGAPQPDNCGTATTSDLSRIVGSPGVDVAAYHDYSPGTAAPPALLDTARVAAGLGRASMVGEAGVTGCGSAYARAATFAAKMASAWRAGTSAYLVWWYAGDGGHPSCDGPVDVDSPTWAVLDRVAAAPADPPAHPGAPTRGGLAP